MNRRTEPRFQVYAPAKVALLESPDREYEGEVLDVSGAGLRLSVETEFDEDQIITIETDQHLILADVRNCLERGAKFGIGAERIHSAAKFSLPPTVSRDQRNHVLIEDFHRRIREELDKAPGHAGSRSTAAAERFQAKHFHDEAETVEPAVATPVFPEVVAAEVVPAEVTASEVMPREAFEIKLETLEVKAEPQEPLPAEIPVAASVPAPETNVSPEVEETPPAPVALPRFATVDPIRGTVEQDDDLSPRARARSRIMAILIAAALTTVAVLALLFGPFAKQAPLQTAAAGRGGTATPTPAPVSPPSSPSTSFEKSAAEKAAAEKAALAKALTPPPPLPTAPPAGKSRASISATDRSWVTACADGTIVFSKLFSSGSKQDLMFTSRAVVRMGNAGPLEIQLNGKPTGRLGNAGEVKVFELTPTGSRFLTPGEASDCTVQHQ
jgi:hypothetical protein